MLKDGKPLLGDFNLSVTADHPFPAYSQLTSDVALPNLKWIDGHKPLFKVNLSMVSSIHPQDDRLLDFMKYFYEYNPRLGSEMEEKALSSSVLELKKANPEPLVKFLHITLNNLATLLVRPSVTEESAKVSGNAFEAMVHIVDTVQSLDLFYDKHERNGILSSYLQFVFNSPQGQHSSGAFDSKTATLTKGRASSVGGSSEEEYMMSKIKGGSVRATKGVHFTGE